MTDFPNDEELLEAPECLTSGCDGLMLDVHPVERVRSDEFFLIRIECPMCHARAWRIERPPQQGVIKHG